MNQKLFEELANASHPASLSIYMPTRRSGRDVRENPIRMKNLVREAVSLAKSRGVERELDTAFTELNRLVDDTEFHNHQGDGLALLASSEGLGVFRLPVPVEELVHIGDRWCVRPLLRAVSDDSRFYTLTLSQNEVRLLECTRDGAREMDANDIPSSLADALGHDWEQPSLQFHTGAQRTGIGGGSTRAAIFHGQGRGGTDDKKEEVDQFLRRVNDGLMQTLLDREPPLVIAGVAQHAEAFRKLTDYPNVVDQGVEGNVEHLSPDEIHAKALKVIAPTLDARAQKSRDRLNALAGSEFVSTGLERALPDIHAGRAEIVVVCPDEPVWGVFDPGLNEVKTRQRPEKGDVDLLDLVIGRALATGAQVIPASRDEIPEGRRMAVGLRYRPTQGEREMVR